MIGGLVVAVAFALEFRSSPTESRPFAADAISPGDMVEELVEWRDVPEGVLPQVDSAGATAIGSIARGEPILPSQLGTGPPVPPGWWSVALPLPETAAPGTAVRVVVDDPPITSEGIVVGAPTVDDFGIDRSGLVALPGAAVDEVARAAGRGGVTVLITP